MITSTTSGVWELDDVYAKRNAERWPPGNNGLFTWGRNGFGVLGQNNKTYYSSPVQVPGTQWSKLSTGIFWSLGLKTDNTLWVWGDNNRARLGLNTVNSTTSQSSPVQLPGTQWSDVRCAYATSLALKSDGTLWSWGYNQVTGQLGQNNETQYSSPVQIPGTQWNAISAAYYTSYATKTDGTLWAWGYNPNGEIGDNSVIPRSSPTQVPGTQWNKFDGGGNGRLYAIKTDGTLWVWGYNGGPFPLNGTTPRSSPTQVPGTQWSTISATYYNGYATKTDGTLWAWGGNSYGALGQNDNIHRSSPIQIPGTQWANDTLHGPSAYHTLMRKTDGTLWGWGISNLGSLGINESGAAPRSSPIQISGTGWINPAVGYYSSAAIKPTY